MSDPTPRPFAQTVDAGRHAAIPPAEAVREELAAAVREGDGLAVLTGAAGLGKSHAAAVLASDLSGEFTAVLVPMTAGLTRRAMLQQVVAELGGEYAGRSEHEVRLALVENARRLSDEGRPAVLLVDEAERCSDRQLEELRGLQNFVGARGPVVRSVLFGGESLEERLASGTLDQVNDRVSCQLTLGRLSERDAAYYLGGRLESCGLSADELLTPEAVVEICRAADGSPRALNFLAGKTLELADGPATAETVEAALTELSALPVAWSRPLAGPGDLDDLFAAAETFDAGELEPLDGVTVEVGSDAPEVAADEAAAGRDGSPLDRIERALDVALHDDADYPAVPSESLEAAFDEPDESADLPEETDAAADDESPLGEFDDVLPSLPAEASDGTHAVADPYALPHSDAVTPGSIEDAYREVSAAEELLDAILPAVSGAEDASALEPLVADAPPAGEEVETDVGAATLDLAAVLAAVAEGPSEPTRREWRRPFVPRDQPPVTDASASDTAVAVAEPPASVAEPVAVESPASEQPPEKTAGLFTRLRRRRLSDR